MKLYYAPGTCALACWTGRLDKTWRDYPNIARFMATMEADPTVQKVLKASSEG